MRRGGQGGFTIIEVMITTLILVVVLGAASSLFVNFLRAFKQQSKIAESGMEGIVGLEILRRDVQHAGFGVPWNGLVAYSEAAAGANATACNPPSNTDPPRALGSLEGVGPFGSDYLVVRAANAGTNDACRKWTSLRTGPATRTWGSPLDDMAAGDRVIVVSPGLDNATSRRLVTAGTFHASFGALASFAPADTTQTYVVYGIDNTASLRMPFNRADYFIATTSVPRNCAPNTGVLVKAVVGQTDGLLAQSHPVLDCVRSMQVRYRLDTDGDGVADLTGDASALAGMSAQRIRDELKEVLIDILAHDGQRDAAYTHSPNPVNVAGANVSIDNIVNYRWRLYSLTVRPLSLRD